MTKGYPKKRRLGRESFLDLLSILVLSWPPSQMKALRLILFFAVSLCGTSCVYWPITTNMVEADSSKSQFDKVEVTVNPGSLEIGITDHTKSLNKLQFVDAVFANEKGQTVPLRFDAKNSLSNVHSEPHDLAIIKLNFSDKYYYPKVFSLRLSTRIDSETFNFSGTFSEHSHTNIEYLPEVLDHG